MVYVTDDVDEYEAGNPGFSMYVLFWLIVEPLEVIRNKQHTPNLSK